MLYIFIALIVGFFIYFALSQTKKQPIQKDGKSILKLPKIFGIVAIYSIALGVFMPIYTLLIIDDFTTAGIISTFIIFLFMAGLGYWLFIWYKNHKVLFDDQAIEVINSTNKSITFKWTEIKNVELNTWTSKNKLTLTNNREAIIHQYLIGVESFIKRAKNENRHLEP